jgi:hypothetical protein
MGLVTAMVTIVLRVVHCHFFQRLVFGGWPGLVTAFPMVVPPGPIYDHVPIKLDVGIDRWGAPPHLGRCHQHRVW